MAASWRGVSVCEREREVKESSKNWRTLRCCWSLNLLWRLLNACLGWTTALSPANPSAALFGLISKEVTATRPSGWPPTRCDRSSASRMSRPLAPASTPRRSSAEEEAEEGETASLSATSLPRATAPVSRSSGWTTSRVYHSRLSTCDMPARNPAPTDAHTSPFNAPAAAPSSRRGPPPPAPWPWPGPFPTRRTSPPRAAKHAQAPPSARQAHSAILAAGRE